MRRIVLSVVLACAFTAAPLSPSIAEPGPAPGSPAWIMRDTANMEYATGRMQDEYANPAYGRYFWTETVGNFPANVSDQLHHPDRPMVSLAQWIPGGTSADPYRQHWAGARGTRTPIEYDNRYGARITGNIWGPKLPFRDPVTGETSNGPFPAIVITTGSIQGYEELYWWAAQGLAEAGYVVMTYDVQGQGQSETFPHPAEQFCDPNGGWRAAQEYGSRETGPCAGFPFQQGANFVLGTIDALNFFFSSANPLLGLVDTSRVGLAGHSAGAGAVTLVGNADARISAVVAWDNASLPDSIAPRIPTMGQNAEYFFNPAPQTTTPNPGGRSATFRRFRDAEIPAMQVALRGSTHLEWTFVPYILPASRKGERVAMYYTLAWFDRWLKGAADDRQAADARRRLTAMIFGASADASSIGFGSWDPSNNSNVPYTIEGDCAADHMSIYYRSALAFDGLRMDDMRDTLACAFTT